MLFHSSMLSNVAQRLVLDTESAPSERLDLDVVIRKQHSKLQGSEVGDVGRDPLEEKLADMTGKVYTDTSN